MDFKTLPRCGAKARSNGYLPCRQAAMHRSGRCYYHGGKSRMVHGRYTKSSKTIKQLYRSLITDARQTIHDVGDMLGKNT
jgi:hypothetical protein